MANIVDRQRIKHSSIYKKLTSRIDGFKHTRNSYRSSYRMIYTTIPEDDFLLIDKICSHSSIVYLQIFDGYILRHFLQSIQHALSFQKAVARISEIHQTEYFPLIELGHPFSQLMNTTFGKSSAYQRTYGATYHLVYFKFMLYQPVDNAYLRNAAGTTTT